MKYPQNPPGTNKQTGTLNNHENPLETMKNKPETDLDHLKYNLEP